MSSTEVKSQLKHYCLTELRQVVHPSNSKKSVEILNIDILVDALYGAFDYNTNDPDLFRVKSNFESNFSTIFDLNKDKMPLALENLATNFEPFLKILAEIKFKNDAYFASISDAYLPINKSSLSDLIRGIIPNKDSTIRYENALEYPRPLLEPSGTEQAIYQYIASNLRNNVHYAKTYSVFEIVKLANIIIGGYLLATKFNLREIFETTSPEIDYLKAITLNKDLINTNKNHIILGGKRDIGEEIDFLVNGELADDEEYDQEEDLFTIQAVDDDLNLTTNSILAVVNGPNSLIVVGPPGAGKTTTLRNILFENASEILKGNLSVRFPIFLDAARYTSDYGFSSLCNEALAGLEVNKILKKYDVVFLIDAINEVQEHLQHNAQLEITNMIRRYSKATFVITSRRFNMYNRWLLPVYELNTLTNQQIDATIQERLSPIKAENLLTLVKQTPEISELAKTPLLLIMLIRIAGNSKSFKIKSRSHIYRFFYDGILIRDRKVGGRIIELMRTVFCELSFHARMYGYSQKISRQRVTKLIDQCLVRLDPNIGVQTLLDKYVDIGFLTVENDGFRFAHETLQEYFSALELLRKFEDGFDNVSDFLEEKWIEPISIAIELSDTDAIGQNIIYSMFNARTDRDIKRLQDFSGSDLNTDIYIPSRIPGIVRSTHPSLYRTAEKLLLNNFRLYSYISSFKPDLPPFKFLTKALAALNSPLLYNKVFSSVKMLVYWFNESSSVGGKPDNDVKTSEENNQSFFSALNSYSNSYILFEEVQKNISSLYLPKDLERRILAFIKAYQESIPIAELEILYKAVPTQKLAKILARHDPIFIIDNYRNTEAYLGAIVHTLLRHNIKITEVQTFLLFLLKDEGVSIKLRAQIAAGLLETDLDHAQLIPSIRLLCHDDFLLQTRSILRKPLRDVPYNILIDNGLSNLFSGEEKNANYPINCPIVNIDRPNLYHPTNIASDEVLLKHLRNDCNKAIVKKFIQKCNLVHRYKEVLYSFNFGIVIRQAYSTMEDSRVVLYDFEKQHPIYIKMQSPVMLNDLFIIENNGALYSISRLELPTHIFSKGIVLSYNSTKGEGFIRSNDFGEDFFFTNENCINFSPEKHQKVSFIAGKNCRKNFFGKPFAYLITI